MQFSKKIIRSFIDLPDHTSMIIYSIGCNLRCYQCFVYDSLVTNPVDICDENYIIDQIKQNGFLFDSIIISGGEFLINKIEDIISFLQNIRLIFYGLIIVNTNGTYTDKLKQIKDLKLVDGIHLDIKLPPNTINKQITGVMEYNIAESISIVSKNNSEYSQFRTVKYPILNESIFIEIKEYVDQINIKNQSNIRWYLNEFLEGDHY
jgi:pyruvate-formate lyase-activating enzyme